MLLRLRLTKQRPTNDLRIGDNLFTESELGCRDFLHDRLREVAGFCKEVTTSVK